MRYTIFLIIARMRGNKLSASYTKLFATGAGWFRSSGPVLADLVLETLV